MENQELFEQIERYINNEMGSEEKSSFKREMDENPSLAKAVHEQRETQMAVELGALNESLNEIHDEVLGTRKGSRTNWWAIAAGIAIIIAAGVYLFQQGSTQDQLFATYSTTDPGLPVPMSSVDHYVFYDAMVDYKAEKYEVAIKKWKGLVRAEPANDTLNYYVGSAYYNLESYNEAVKFFDKIDPESDSGLRYKSQWYKILSWIKLNEKEKILAQEPYPGSPYSDKINEIQKALEK